MTSLSLIPQEPFEILGTIVWVRPPRSRKKEADGNFKVLDARSGIAREFMVACRWECPVEKGDIFYGYCQPNTTAKDNGDTLKSGSALGVTALKPPFVRVGTDEETLIRFFCKYVRGWSRSRAQEMYASLVRICGTEQKVDEYLSKLSEQWVQETDDSLLTQFADLLNPKSMAALLSSWYEEYDRRRLLLLGLNREEINACEAVGWSCYSLYGACLSNPFQVYPLSFSKCRVLLERMKRTADPQDMECGEIIRRIYDHVVRRGWTCTPAKFLVQDFPHLPRVGAYLKDNYDIHIDMGGIYLDHYYQVETRVAEYLSRLVLMDNESSAVRGGGDTLPIEFRNIDGDEESPISPDQRTAIEGALKHHLSIITGGAGTGKTTAIREMVYNLERRGISYAICAFTGKAVARLRQVLQNPTPMTLHLKIKQQKSARFEHLIIDEASMLEMSLFLRFVDCFRFPYKITLVGDVHQLPPIHWGSLFSQCIESKVIPTFYLTQNHRVYQVQGEQDGILLNAHKIIRNTTTSPIRFYPTDNFTLLKGNMKHVVAIAKCFHSQGFSPYEITVITPYNRDLNIINKSFQELYHGGQTYVEDPQRRKWYVGDRVMMTKNDYEINVMNGEEGRVIRLLEKAVVVSFGPGRDYEFPLAPKFKKNTHGKVLKQEKSVQYLVHSYAVTTHKGQGSEWNYVLMYLPPAGDGEGRSSSSFINKNLLYTSITRAKRAFYFVGDVELFRSSTAISLPFRAEKLAARLRAVCPPAACFTEIDDYDEDIEDDFNEY
jgi:hypothetical protein